MENKGFVPPRLAASLVAQLADAVHHAHARGILHRDLKPSNILLEPIDAPASDLPYRPLLTDFGLAKRIEDNGEHTKSGTLLGTVQYMAPEQALGQLRHVGIHSDIYSLGVILYELLTGRPPYVGPTASELLRQIEQDDPAPMRSVRAGAPRDMEAICIKCLAKRPGDRYPTAESLSLDLLRFLDRKPVTARSLGRPTRVWRWCRRRPLLAGMTAALAAMMATIMIGTWVMYRREHRLRQAADSKREFAQRAADDIYIAVVEQWLNKQPDLEGTRQKFLQKALAFYEELANHEGPEPEIRFAASRALNRVANIQSHLGMTFDAIANRKRCLDILRGLVDESPHNSDYRYDQFYNLLLLSHGLQELGRPEESVDQLRRAYAAIRALVADEPANSTYQDALAACSGSLGSVLLESNERDAARRAALDGLEVAEKLAARHPKRPMYEKNIATNLEVLMRLAEKAQDYALAERLCGQSADVYRRLAGRLPQLPALRVNLASKQSQRAALLEHLTEHENAALAHDEASRVAEQVLDEEYSDVFVRSTFATVKWAAGEFYFDHGDHAKAEGSFRSAIDLLTLSVRENPQYQPHRRMLAGCLRQCPVGELRDLDKARQLEQNLWRDDSH
jgi:serine/threonine-protein kinase